MTDSKLVDWLLENGGPVARYRTAVELCQPSWAEENRLRKDLLSSPLVQSWLNRLTPGRIHNSKDTDFENAMGKLVEFGLRAGLTDFDKRTAPFRAGFSAMLAGRPGMMRTLNAVILASGLVRAGYEHEDSVNEFLLDRLDTLYRTIREAGHDIYVDADSYAGIPGPWRRNKVPLVNPAFTPDGEFRLPYIHDVYALSRLPGHLRNAAVTRKLSAVVRYILAPEYQGFPPGYGLLQADKRTYRAVGWAAHLPDSHALDSDSRAAQVFVQRVELMAHFPIARKNPRFREAVQHLETFQTETGRYGFPRRYLRESPDSYWVTGAHMGLEENRNTPKALELESTFRILKIRQLISEMTP